MKRSGWIVLAVLVATVMAGQASATLVSTDTPSAWLVTANVTHSDLNQTFLTTGFTTASAVTGRAHFIADVPSGSHGGVGNYTFFVFRQMFDLTGYDPSTVDLKFQWAADDSGEGFADRGTWTPKFSLNGGTQIPYPGSNTYGLSSVVDLNTGFISGINQIDFYVEGNGWTDGFALQIVSFTAGGCPTGAPVPEPATLLLLGAGLIGLAGYGRRKLA